MNAFVRMNWMKFLVRIAEVQKAMDNVDAADEEMYTQLEDDVDSVINITRKAGKALVEYSYAMEKLRNFCV